MVTAGTAALTFCANIRPVPGLQSNNDWGQKEDLETKESGEEKKKCGKTG